ncbi:hypothetical protein [Nonomuraea jabiensis]|uniref:Uncharacterized protein n=1 Tax=Nonomuraea jabiensis TaxID=882448 RepID=A0A7W9G0R9_9ACTN|nr:hypothetical protein [Nonomuraea jabiensis]MBB5775073.1 hypothetical protein [Nonomuraea jabiensis]
MRVWRLFADWFWRVDRSLGGAAEPHRGQRFSAAHPVCLGLIIGPAFGALIGVMLLISAMAGGQRPLTSTTLLFSLGFSVFVGVFFVGLGYFERLRQRHYGHYQEPRLRPPR